MKFGKFRSIAIATIVAGAGIFSAIPAEAATTFTQTALSATVTGTSVKATTTVKASASTVAEQYGVCVRTSSNENADFVKATNVTITTTGTKYDTPAKTFAPGTYGYFPCLKPQGSAFTSVGASKKFTVESSGPTVLFEDNFTGAAGTKDTNFTEWSSCTYSGSAAYGKIGCGDRATLDGSGHLSIPATPAQGTSVSTKDTFRFTYGTVTTRAMIQTQQGYWPAIWALNSGSHGEQQGGSVGEADTLEAYTQYNDGYRVGEHNYTNGVDNGPKGGNPLCGGGDVRGAYHDYTLKVEPSKISYIFDGTVCKVWVPSDVDGPYAFGPTNTSGIFLLLTNAVDNASGAPAPTQNSVLLVDSVKVTSL